MFYKKLRTKASGFYTEQQSDVTQQQCLVHLDARNCSFEQNQKGKKQSIEKLKLEKTKGQKRIRKRRRKKLKIEHKKKKR